MDIIHRVKETVGQYQLFRSGDSIVVGVSGGADSMALLYLLKQMQAEYGLRLMVVHCNHQIRKSAIADQRFVERVCHDLLMPCEVVRLTVKRKAERGSWEDLAREKRLAVLTDIARLEKADCIALGHHLDDCAETVLLHLLRGAGLQGLQGILPSRRINNVLVIRPLIKISKAEIVRFLKRQKISFCHDETNDDTRFFRNKIRLELLPLLEREYQPNIKNLLAGLAETAGWDYDYLDSQVALQLKKVTVPRREKKDSAEIFLKIPPLENLHPSLRHMLFRRVVAQIKGNTKRLTLAHIREIDALIESSARSSVLSLPGRIAIKKEKGLLLFRQNDG